MNTLTREQRVQVVQALCEGVAVNAVVRMTGIAKTTILRLIGDLGRVCMQWEDAQLRGLFCAEVEADECWAFNYCKAKTLPKAKTPAEAAGDVWTWYAIDRRSKCILSWMIGDRDAGHASAFMHDLRSRLVGAPDLTTDALGIYANAVFDAFQTGVHYAQVHKVYKTTAPDAGHLPGAVCIGCQKRPIIGSPALEKAGTSRIERANLSLRMHVRRWGRRTNAHSKSIANMQAMFAIYACWFNWARPHASLDGKTPAMALGLVDRRWTVADLVGMLDAEERRAIEAGKLKRGPYGPRKSAN